jgi:DNA-binding MarR family transcriptional regulator
VSPRYPDDQHVREILDVLAHDPTVSQRSLASRVGIALGLANLLMKRLVVKGFVRVVHVRPNRVRYLLTPAGIAEKARMSRTYLQYSVRFYAEARDRIRESFALLSSQWPGGSDVREKPVVFYGTSELAEIGYICLQETDLDLIAVIDDRGRRRFFGVPVYTEADLRGDGISGRPFGQLVVMSFTEADAIRKTLNGSGFPEQKIFWI